MIFQFGIRTQIILNLIIITLLTVGLIGAATLKVTSNSIRNEKVKSGKILIKSIQKSIDSIFMEEMESFEYNLESPRLARFIHSYTEEDELKTLFIVDKENRIVTHSDKRIQGKTITDEDLENAILKGRVITRFEKGDRWFYWGISNLLRISAPIYMGSEVIGGIRADFSLLDVQKSIVQTQKIILLYIVFDSVLIVAIGTFLLFRGIVKPIRGLLNATKKIALGDFSQRMEKSSINEMSELSLSFNRASRKLEEYAKSIEKADTELKQAQQEVIRSEKLASVGRLAAGVAHEIGNPIGAILGYVHILKAGVNNAEEEAEYVKRIEAESDRINTIISELLYFSRASEIEVDYVDVNRVIDNTISMITPQKILKDIMVDLRFEQSIPHVKANENQLQQVIINLIINAVDAMPDGGKLTVQTAKTMTQKVLQYNNLLFRRKDDPPDTDFSHFRKNTSPVPIYRNEEDQNIYITIRISDTGCGIKDEDLPRIFDPFYTTKSPGQGTGLGLAICLRIIESFNGQIKVENNEQGGASFIILLPVGDYKKS
ncbi:MAG: ATP-binding protein [Thermodesulfobacteriota bacterium]|nr:ATP-binding protein [Thermodesulfobacteriota bacterium]